jgi:hypothetical protein
MAKDTDDTLINGLLRKRHEMATEAVAVRDRLGQLCSAIDSIDHVLSTWGEKPEKGFNPRSGLVIVFKRHELRRFVLDCLKEANGKPITSSEIAAKLMNVKGQDYEDRRLRYEITKKVGKTLKALGEQRIAVSRSCGINLEWRLANGPAATQ